MERPPPRGRALAHLQRLQSLAVVAALGGCRTHDSDAKEHASSGNLPPACQQTSNASLYNAANATASWARPGVVAVKVSLNDLADPAVLFGDPKLDGQGQLAVQSVGRDATVEITPTAGAPMLWLELPTNCDAKVRFVILLDGPRGVGGPVRIDVVNPTPIQQPHPVQSLGYGVVDPMPSPVYVPPTPAPSNP